MNAQTYEHHTNAIISLCVGMSIEQLDELISDLEDLLTNTIYPFPTDQDERTTR